MDEVLARSGIFQGVDPEAADMLVKEMETIDIRKGEVLFSEGEPGDSLYIVLSGKLKIGRRAAGSRQNLIAVMGPSDMVGELALFDPGPRTATATAVTDTRLARLRKTALRPWLTNRRRSPSSCCGAGPPPAPHQRRARRPDLHGCTGPGREEPAADGRPVRQPGRRRPARHPTSPRRSWRSSSARRETVNKALADFASRGWLRLDGKSVIILDPERLARRARV
jgi:hypothetical protein